MAIQTCRPPDRPGAVFWSTTKGRRTDREADATTEAGCVQMHARTNRILLANGRAIGNTNAASIRVGEKASDLIVG